MSTTIHARAAGSAVTFDGDEIQGEIAGFTLRNAAACSAGVEIKNATNGITVARNVIRNNAGDGVSVATKSSAQVSFNTIVGNAGVGVSATGAGSWVQVRNSILDANAIGLKAVSGALVRNDYNLLHNTANLSGVTAGGTPHGRPAFATTGDYVPGVTSPALDAADPLAEVPAAGGTRADLGYKELIACPLTLVFGPAIDATVTGNSGVARSSWGSCR